jgi:hypothetical protein
VIIDTDAQAICVNAERLAYSHECERAVVAIRAEPIRCFEEIRVTAGVVSRVATLEVAPDRILEHREKKLAFALRGQLLSAHFGELHRQDSNSLENVRQVIRHCVYVHIDEFSSSFRALRRASLRKAKHLPIGTRGPKPALQGRHDEPCRFFTIVQTDSWIAAIGEAPPLREVLKACAS